MKKILLQKILTVSFVLLSCGIIQSADGENPLPVTLRSSYMNLSLFDAQSMPHVYMRKDDKWGFYGHSTIAHRYEEKSVKGGKVIVDHSTGLMWIQSGSRDYMRWASAKDWIEKLNYRKYAGYNDWRLPTLEEAITLLEPERKSNGLYIDPLFNDEQWGIWSGDIYGQGGAWSVYFSLGNARWNVKNRYVRPVRSLN